MQSVNDRWYKIYGLILSVAGFGCAFVSALALSMPRFNFLQQQGFTILTLVLSVVIIIYRLFLFSPVVKNYGLQIATFVLSLLVMLQNINLINNTGQLHSWFHVAWLVMIFFGGMFGSYIILSFLMLTSIYMILIMTNIPGKLHLDVFSIGVVGLNYAVGAISYMFWKRMYIDQENLQVARLSGALRGKQQQAEILIQSIADGIIVTDTEGKINLLNPAAAKMTDWTVAEALGIDIKLVAKLQQEDGKDIVSEGEPFHQVLKTNKQFTGILRLAKRDNSFAIISIVISPILLPNSSELIGTVAVFRDVSTARAEENRRADFISTASHEMRTPVAAIEGYLALALNDKVSQIDVKARSYLVKAHESTQRLGKLFQDLLTSAKAEDGRLVNHPQVVEMGSYLQELTDGLRFAAEKKGLLMDFTVGATSQGAASNIGGGKIVKPLYYAHIDPDRVREAITNLFDNAVKYTESGKVTIALTGNDQVIQLFIRDTGPGIPPEDVPHLFQKFYRVDNSATRTIGGTGLGLFICRKIIELYNGRIWVESVLDRGSTFYINLPRLNAQKVEEMLKAEQVTASLQL